MVHAVDHHAMDDAPPKIRIVAASRPFTWLRRGWADLVRARNASLAFGALVAACGVGLLALAWGATYLVPALLGGFLLVAPFGAVVFYALSRQIQRGEPVDGPRPLDEHDLARAVTAARAGAARRAVTGTVVGATHRHRTLRRGRYRHVSSR